MNNKVVAGEELLAAPLHSNGKDRNPARSELAQEIISRRPDMIERWALLAFLFILLLLLGSTWFIHYPDTIEANAILTASNAPKEILPIQPGRLVKLFVHNNEQVKKSQFIGWIESIASHAEVIDLSMRLDKAGELLAKDQADKVSHLFDTHYKHLGELQTAYQIFMSEWQQFNDFRVNDFYNKKKRMLHQDILALHQMNNTINRQKEIATQDVQLAEESFKMNEVLANEKIISPENYRNEKSRYLSKQSSLPQLNAQQISNESQVREKQKEIDQLEHDITRQQLIFEQALQTLKSAVADWINKYTLTAPINGKVVFIVPLQENRVLQQGKLLGYVVPDSAGYYAEATLPQYNFGKLDTGLRVQLRFDAYPYQEFGHVEGLLEYISRVPSDSGFLSSVKLEKGLVTNYGKTLQYKSGLTAHAIVITRNMRLMQRIYYGLVDATSVKK